MANPSTPTFKNVGDCSPNPLRIDAPVYSGGYSARVWKMEIPSWVQGRPQKLKQFADIVYRF